MTSTMPQVGPFSTANFCTPLKSAMRLDERDYCDRTGKSRAQFADELGVSVWSLNQWLSPHGAEMPQEHDQRWAEVTQSFRIFERPAGSDVDRLMQDFLVRMQRERRSLDPWAEAALAGTAGQGRARTGSARLG